MLKSIDNLSSETAKSLSGFFGSRLSDKFALFSLLDFQAVDGAWVQIEKDEVTALIVQKEMSKVYVTANSNADLYGMADFIRGLGGMVVHCPSELTSRLGVTAFSKLSLTELSGGCETTKKAVDLSGEPRKAFELITQKKLNILKDSLSGKDLKKYTEKAYREWLSKIKRGIDGGFTAVTAVTAGENSVLCAAVSDRLDKTVYLREIAEDTDFSKMGYSSDCVKAVCGELSKNGEVIFTACDDIKTENFYKKIGFERKDYLDLGIVEL